MDSAQRWEVGEENNIILRKVTFVFNYVIIIIYNKQQPQFCTGVSLESWSYQSLRGWHFHDKYS